ncbi:MAG: hypothetical protein NZM09_09930 [Ignavibacterium sp.]|nr:hypothetical protein [Ignavibacterium sp.]MCX7611139.1 hypothetical protein [Ignavibacterium sp.]MDW8375996.1 hypothetical protein [Ignavibacteriales bacterium]
MKLLLSIVSILFIMNSASFAQKAATLTGEIIELKTFVVDKIKPNSPAGLEVTKEGLMKGGTFALLESKSNKIVILIPSAVNRNLYSVLEPYLGMQVFIKGQQYSNGGVRLLSVEDIGKSLK